MKKLLLTGLLLFGSISEAAGQRKFVYASDQYIYTHSQEANALGKQDAESRALHSAMAKMKAACGVGNFQIRQTRFRLLIPRGAAVPVICRIDFVCY